MFDLLYTSVAHEVLPVSLVDSVTAKVDDEKDLAYSIYMWYTSCCILFQNTFYMHFVYVLHTFYIHSIYTYRTHVRSR